MAEFGRVVTTFTISVGIGLIVVQWLSSALGGFITGRLRTKWTGVHTHEVFFRDTAVTPTALPCASKSAVLSPCGLYRYILRPLLLGRSSASVYDGMLNPSTADADADDTTITPCD
jgi:hypothetical protein